ncbi:katanin p60 ATPase-containing subunit A1 [Elysia marginata]|uniref:Katanin p60 ATPase-containing subunit A1 n=1 Tax=Elysia marginata TaxID=1093978 RepID=A0AAV4FTW6_9GAST|nr:katanin p60 ATPase-containing subunit A1 [Elysia marginata]
MVLGGSRDGDRDQDNDSGNDNINSNNTSINLSVTATPQARRIIMDGDGDGAPSSSADSSPRHKTDEKLGEHGAAEETGKIGVKSNTTIKFDDSSAESTPRRSKSAHQDRSSPGMKSPGSSTNTPGRGGQDLSSLDMKASWGESSTGGGSAKGSPESSTSQEGQTGYKCAFKAGAGMLADPVKIAREREKEERVRQARERLMEERRKKLEELREQQRIAQENRERQLEMRRQKIEDLRRRDSERRAAVEERRRIKEETERARRESILQKAEERVARYEAWKAGGRKGGRGHVLGFGSATPRDICQRLERPRRSSSQSALGPRSPNGSDMGSVRPQRRALSACSAVRRHYCVDMNRMGPSPFVTSTSSSNHHSMAASMPSPVRLRDRAGGGPRKQRPNSVATSMPSFLGGEPARSPRSKSTDRGGRDRSKARSSSRREKSKEALDKSKDGDQEEGKDGATKEKKTPSRVSLSFFDRLATPKFSKKDPVDQSPREAPPKKDTPILRLSPRKAYSTSNLSAIKKRSSLGPSKPSPSSGKDSTTPARRAPSRDSPRTRQSTGPSTPHASSTRAVSPASKRNIAPPEAKSGSSSPRITPPPTSSPSVSSSPSHHPTPTVDASASAASEDGTVPATSSPAPRTAPSSTQDITAEEYKARLAEKRRQAREKAEREAEEERKRQEEERRLEEERRREEEEEERRQEEEALRLAEEARKAEQERLERAIEAEEKRKKEEAERLEAERIAKEEAERKAKEEAERLHREQQERARREEEERLQRKKKLEMIMKRVKPDAGGSSSAENSPLKVTGGTPTMSQANSSQVSPTEGEEKPLVESSRPASSPEEEAVGTPQEGQAIEPISDAMMSSFYVQEGDDSPLTNSTTAASGVVRSASSGDILDSPNEEGPREGNAVSSSQLNTSSSSLTSTPTKTDVDGESSKPRFKSPLLQQLVENKGTNGGDSSTPKFKSPLLQNLLGKTRVGARMGLSASMGDLSPNKEVAGGTGQSALSSSNDNSTSNSLMTTSMIGGINSSSVKELERQEQGEVDKDEDTSLHQKHSISNGVRFDGEDNGDFSHKKDDAPGTPSNGVLMGDSALGSSIGFTMGQSSQSVISNGHHKTLNLDMDDSSISLHSVDESVGPTSVQPPSTVFEAEEGAEQQQGPTGPQGDGQSQFDEVIDLLDTSSSSASASNKASAPIIAFEESRRPDVTESLS